MNGPNRSDRAASPQSSKHEVLRRVTRQLAARRSSPIDLADAQREIVARVFFESAVGEAGDDAEGRRSLEQLGRCCSTPTASPPCERRCSTRRLGSDRPTTIPSSSAG